MQVGTSQKQARLSYFKDLIFKVFFLVYKKHIACICVSMWLCIMSVGVHGGQKIPVELELRQPEDV